MANNAQNRPSKLPVKEQEKATFPLPPRREEPRSDKIEAAPEEEAEEVSLERWKELVDALHLHRRRLLRIPGVTGVDLGYKIEDGKFTNEIALRVHVERKMPPGSFEDRPYDLVKLKSSAPPEDFTSEKTYCILNNVGVPMDVIEADYRPVQLSEPPRPRSVLEKPQHLTEDGRRRRLDPLVGGISIGSPQTPVGTLGALVWDNIDGSVCILSNWHVLSGDLHAEIGTPCFQPGRFDQGRSSDVVAHLKRWRFDCQTDAAIAELTGNRHYCAGEIVSMFQQISDVTDPYLGMMVLKSGRSTGFTWGFVDGLYFSSVIKYSNGVVQVFEDQIHIAPADPNVRISESGDSGSVWVTETNGEGYKAVGLHFAGDLPHSAFGEYALANPMRLVAKRLNFSFRPRFLEIRDEGILSPPTDQIERRGAGVVRPVGLIGGGTLTGPGGQPVSNPIDPGGKT